MKTGKKKSLKKRMNGMNRSIHFPGSIMQGDIRERMINDDINDDMNDDMNQDILYHINPNIFVMLFLLVICGICLPFILLVRLFNYLKGIKQRKKESKERIQKRIQKRSIISEQSKPLETLSRLSCENCEEQVRSVKFDNGCVIKLKGTDHVG